MSDNKHTTNTAHATEAPERKPGRVPRLSLNTITNSRLTLGRLMRYRAAEKISRELFRDLCYALGVQLSYWKLEEELRIEKRLTAIEAKLEDRER